MALYTVMRETAMAGYGIPSFSALNPALRCDPLPTFDHDGNAATPLAGLFPVLITEGGGASDALTVRYGRTRLGGIPISGTFAGTSVTVTNNLGCQAGDIVLVVNGANCAMQKVAPCRTTPISHWCSTGCNSGQHRLHGGRGMKSLRPLAERLTRNGVPSAADVVSLQAQYGLTAVHLL